MYFFKTLLKWCYKGGVCDWGKTWLIFEFSNSVIPPSCLWPLPFFLKIHGLSFALAWTPTIADWQLSDLQYSHLRLFIMQPVWQHPSQCYEMHSRPVQGYCSSSSILSITSLFSALMELSSSHGCTTQRHTHSQHNKHHTRAEGLAVSSANSYQYPCAALPRRLYELLLD